MEARSGLSKTAKRNKQRAAAKRRAALASGAPAKPKPDVVTPEELKEVLNRDMEAAKEKNDQEEMKSLREQIWVVNDMIAGVKTDLPDDELKKILGKLPVSNALKKKQKARAAETKAKENKAPEKASPKEKGSSKPGSESGLKMPIEEAEKKLRNLKKKLKDAQKINAKIANGEKVEKNQMEKAKMEKALAEEVDDLEIDIKTERLNR